MEAKNYNKMRVNKYHELHGIDWKDGYICLQLVEGFHGLIYWDAEKEKVLFNEDSREEHIELGETGYEKVLREYPDTVFDVMIEAATGEIYIYDIPTLTNLRFEDRMGLIMDWCDTEEGLQYNELPLEIYCGYTAKEIADTTPAGIRCRKAKSYYVVDGGTGYDLFDIV